MMMVMRMMMMMMMMKVDADDDDDDDDGDDDAERTRTGPHAVRSDLEHQVNYNAKISKVQSSTGECFVQGLQYKVVLGSTLCKLCSAK